MMNATTQTAKLPQEHLQNPLIVSDYYEPRRFRKKLFALGYSERTIYVAEKQVKAFLDYLKREKNIVSLDPTNIDYLGGFIREYVRMKESSEGTNKSALKRIEDALKLYASFVSGELVEKGGTKDTYRTSIPSNNTPLSKKLRYKLFEFGLEESFRTYSKHIRRFLNYLNEKGIVKVDEEVIEEYLFLLEHNQNRSKKTVGIDDVRISLYFYLEEVLNNTFEDKQKPAIEIVSFDVYKSLEGKLSLKDYERVKAVPENIVGDLEKNLARIVVGIFSDRLNIPGIRVSDDIPKLEELLERYFLIKHDNLKRKRIKEGSYVYNEIVVLPHILEAYAFLGNKNMIEFLKKHMLN